MSASPARPTKLTPTRQAKIVKAMPDDWRAAIAFLERRFPERWRLHRSHEVAVERTDSEVDQSIRDMLDEMAGADDGGPA